METILDLRIKFSPEYDYSEEIDELIDFCRCVESVENKFEIEISCGDGKFLNDLWDQWKLGTGELSDEEFEKYDGEVDWSYPPRDGETKNLLSNRTHSFVVKMDKDECLYYYLDGKKKFEERGY
jgi:hypothetical protein